MTNMSINIARDYSAAPGGRYVKDGKFSGEEFREKVLGPKLKTALRSNDTVEVDLDGTYGFSSSFLDEVFGGLVRDLGIPRATLDKHLIILANSEHSKLYRALALRYIEEASKQIRVT